MKKLIFTVGITGCGKSKWLSDKEPVIETDEIRKDIFGNINDIQNDGYIFQEARKRIIELFNKCDTVYFGSTMVETKYRIPFIKEIKDKCIHDIEFEAVIFKCDPEISKQRISKDLKNNIDRSNSLEVVDQQYEFYKDTLKSLDKEGLYSSYKYVGFDSLDEIKKI